MKIDNLKMLKNMANDSLPSKPVPDTIPLSHKEALELTRRCFQELINDPLLSDIPGDVTAAEIKAKLDFEKGKAFQIQLKRPSEVAFEYIPIIVKQSTTVSQLKCTIQRAISRKIKEEKGPTCLSWKYFWRTYLLVHNNEKLTDNNKTMAEYTITAKSEITFIKKLRKK